MTTVYGFIIGSGKTGRRLAGMLALLVLVLFSVSALADSSDSWRIKVRDAVCVEGPQVLLGDIAYPVGEYDRAQWEKIAQIKLWKASKRKGRPVSLSRPKLEDILKYYIGDMVKLCVLPSQMSIQTGGRVLDNASLEREVVEFLTIKGKALGDDVEFKKLALPQNFFFPNKYDKFVLTLPSGIKPGMVRIRMESMTSDGKINRKAAGSAFANVWKAVPCASRPVNRYERITPDKVKFIKMNLAYNTEIWDGTGGPWRLTRPVGTGQPFRMGVLEQMPTIARGDVVTLEYLGKALRLSTKAKALADAHLGQQIEVQNLQSQRTVVAVVVGSNKVQVR